MLSIFEIIYPVNSRIYDLLYEMRFITSPRYGMTIEYDPSPDRLGDDYFKAYQGIRVNKQTPRARISFFPPEYVIHNDGTHEPKWELDARDRENLMALLTADNLNYPNRTNWQQLIKEYNKMRQNAYFGDRDRNVVFLRNRLQMPNYLNLK